jgi:hypothetical protein
MIMTGLGDKAVTRARAFEGGGTVTVNAISCWMGSVDEMPYRYIRRGKRLRLMKQRPGYNFTALNVKSRCIPQALSLLFRQLGSPLPSFSVLRQFCHLQLLFLLGTQSTGPGSCVPGDLGSSYRLDRRLDGIGLPLIFNHVFQSRHIQYVQLMLLAYDEFGAGEGVQFARYCFAMST